jgi:hypothetical protein
MQPTTVQTLERSGLVHRQARAGILLAALSITLVVAACSSGTNAAGAQAAGGGATTISITTPADGAQVSVPFDVEVGSSVPLGAPDTGDHHAHLYFDTSTDSGDYDIIYGTSWQVTRTLTPGPHRLTLALANADHSLAGPTATITVNVTGSGSGSGSGAGAPANPAPATVGPGYNY